MGELIKNYKEARRNLQILERYGAKVLHGVDATDMESHEVLIKYKFDRIIFNFPHAGFHGKEDNPDYLVERFFWNANMMLKLDGEIHVNHKTSAPFSLWNIEELAGQNNLRLIERVDFKIEDYPGYNQKRGHRARCDEPFPLGESSTFKFGLSFLAKLRRAPTQFNYGKTDHLPTLLVPVRFPAGISFNNSPILGIFLRRENAQTPHERLPMLMNVRNANLQGTEWKMLPKELCFETIVCCLQLNLQ
ncbi:hypothetical protein Tsubulata_015794 [Turnera subulata]|uniref:25S rRNA (uridine-N(3))-methyltransferase BMT5-like domain-containing protein n=1 Tax=Turnera subulata TaxID=218843 RepID=A0A9Q0G1Z8_9ROSI|nr:hypothetical protein Tsubulata_015794 [Turnera subulata]